VRVDAVDSNALFLDRVAICRMRLVRRVCGERTTEEVDATQKRLGRRGQRLNALLLGLVKGGSGQGNWATLLQHARPTPNAALCSRYNGMPSLADPPCAATLGRSKAVSLASSFAAVAAAFAAQVSTRYGR